jgi:hypothetical protein
VADEEKPIKVSDFRMFTPDGELKPEYRDLETASAESSVLEPPATPAPAPSAPPPSPEPGFAGEGTPGGAEPDFVDLVRRSRRARTGARLAREPGGPAARDLPGARLSSLAFPSRAKDAKQSLLPSRILPAPPELRMA